MVHGLSLSGSECMRISFLSVNSVVSHFIVFVRENDAGEQKTKVDSAGAKRHKVLVQHYFPSRQAGSGSTFKSP